jgi:hypothetical protein
VILEQATIPRAAAPAFQHCLDTYASETNKLTATWLRFNAEDWGFRIDPKASSVGEILKHQLLSERRFFAEFLALSEPPAAELLPALSSPQAYSARALEDETWAGADPTLGLAAAERK